MQVRKVMSREVERIPPETSIRDAARRMREQDIGAIPVYEGDRLIGMVTDRDIATRALGDGCDPESPVRQILSQGVEYCFDDEKCAEVGRRMREKQIRRLVVLNRDKRLVGIVSLGDLSQAGERRAADDALRGVTAP